MSSVDPSQNRPIPGQLNPTGGAQPANFPQPAMPQHQFFKGMPMTAQQQKQFLTNLEKFMSTQLKQEMDHLKKVMEEAKRKIEQSD